MRSLLAMLALAGLLGGTPASAEKRLFIIVNSPDGYGIDRCLASGAVCGSAMATAYCRQREFNRALSFHKVGREEITGTVPSMVSHGCTGRGCEDFVAIECAR